MRTRVTANWCLSSGVDGSRTQSGEGRAGPSGLPSERTAATASFAAKEARRRPYLGTNARRDERRGFTLFELLAVVALMAAATAVAVTCLRGGGSGAARDAAVALLASRVAGARGLATSRGAAARLFVHADPADPARYLRFVVVCEPAGAGWTPVDAGSVLPEGIVVLPPTALTTNGPGAVARPGDDWSRPSGGALRSTALREYSTGGAEPAVLGTRNWLVLHFSPSGGTFAGDLVVAAGRRESAAVPVTVVCEQPDNVAGLSISLYGVGTFARGRSDF